MSGENPIPGGSRIPDRAEALALLEHHAPDRRRFQLVLSHSLVVADLALGFAHRCKDIQLALLEAGSLLHDIGRFQFPKGQGRAEHGFVGAELLRREGYPEVALIAERHVGAGITAEDVVRQGLALPVADYVPLTPEQRLVAHADNLVFGTRVVTFEEVLERFARELGPDYPPRLIVLREEVEKLRK